MAERVCFYCDNLGRVDGCPACNRVKASRMDTDRPADNPEFYKARRAVLSRDWETFKAGGPALEAPSDLICGCNPAANVACDRYPYCRKWPEFVTVNGILGAGLPFAEFVRREFNQLIQDIRAREEAAMLQGRHD